MSPRDDDALASTQVPQRPLPRLMSAAQFHRYGGPEVLEVGLVDRPDPGPGEVLVQVQATAVNPHDAVVRSGGLRIVTGRKFPLGLGLDLAGRVVAVGPAAAGPAAAETATVAVGDPVWGMVSPKGGHRTGAAAGFAVLPADRVAPAPRTLTPVEAASLVTAGTTALRAVRDVAGVVAGHRVLVRGGAGSVGACAVEIARTLGAHVTTVVSDRDAQFAAELGAHEVLSRSVPASQAPRFDVVIDTVGTDLLAWRRRLARGGRMVTVAFGSPSAMLAIAASTALGARRVRTFSSYPDRVLLEDLAGYVDEGAVRPMIGSVLPLADVAAAHRALAEPGRSGKLVLTLGE